MCCVHRCTSWAFPENLQATTTQVSRSEAESVTQPSKSCGRRPLQPFELLDCRVEEFRKKVLPEALTTFAEIFLMSGDRNAFFYTGSQAMHSEKIMIFEVGTMFCMYYRNKDKHLIRLIFFHQKMQKVLTYGTPEQHHVLCP